MKGSTTGGDTTGGAHYQLNPVTFRRRLMRWYRVNARTLPWRDISDPYGIWVSEIMLQQTRVAAVIEYYKEFMRRFPTLVSLALAPEADVLAAWSGLGYYRRARMLHKTAQFIMTERRGLLPASALELRTMPGIGEYTAAAIASIAFGESVAVVDGNVERVILRLTGRASDATAAARRFVREQAQTLMPNQHLHASRPDTQSGDGSGSRHSGNAAGDHNQAMMELGATVCLPLAPHCSQCPVIDLCCTRGEHPTPARAPRRSLPVAHLLDLRKRGPATEVLLERRPDGVALMPAMYELPQLPLETVEGLEPALRLRHAITNTNYYVQVYSPRRLVRTSSGNHVSSGKHIGAAAHALRSAIPKSPDNMHWVRTTRLASLPLTGLTRKILQRLKVMQNTSVALPE
ncbi:MAG TPA: A/G-specific adenine glycosylase [Acidobacteriaceae bacterium]|jgi:A/G-specific adenine glycosylase|nr:A/G-specific adenine glycosylase [Acidobacteriaceae bacterium]